MTQTRPNTVTFSTAGQSLDAQLEQMRANTLAEVGGKNYPGLWHERITGPLGMTDTGSGRPKSNATG